VNGEQNHRDVSFLPVYTPVQENTFNWGEKSGNVFTESIRVAYEEMIAWRRNIFKVPSGRQGKRFVHKLANLFLSYGEGDATEIIALKSAMVFPSLMLQKPTQNSRTKDHVCCLERRLDLWRSGKVEELVAEINAIQTRLPPLQQRNTVSQNEEDSLAFRFASLMSEGKTRAAVRLLKENDGGGPLVLDGMLQTANGQETVREILRNKHPKGKPTLQTAVVNDIPIQEAHPIIYESITSESILKAVLRTDGSAGPSGLDAQAWRRICTSYQSASSELCNALALVARKICSTYVDPEPLKPLNACRLVALDKCPGVRPIGIGEVPRRIIAKAILSVVSEDIQQVAGVLQCCAGQKGGCEAAIHAMQSMASKEETEGVLLIDAENAFNSLNRMNAMANIQALCPSLAKIVINTYRTSTDLYIQGECIKSEEGITQGDPLAMSIYAIGIRLLICKTSDLTRQNLIIIIGIYADDATAADKLI
jgi:hypothetical protein